MTEKQAVDEPTTVAMGVFHDRHIAMGAVNDLKRQNFYSHQIGVVSTNGSKRGGKNPGVVGRNHGKGALAGLVAGAIVGVVTGGTFAIVVGLGIGTGLLGGVVIGAVMGLVLGALTGMGIPRRDPNYYNKPFDAGKSIVIVACNGNGTEAREILRRHGGRDLDEQNAAVNVAGRSMVRTPATTAPPVGSTPTNRPVETTPNTPVERTTTPVDSTPTR